MYNMSTPVVSALRDFKRPSHSPLVASSIQVAVKETLGTPRASSAHAGSCTGVGLGYLGPAWLGLGGTTVVDDLWRHACGSELGEKVESRATPVLLSGRRRGPVSTDALRSSCYATGAGGIPTSHLTGSSVHPRSGVMGGRHGPASGVDGSAFRRRLRSLEQVQRLSDPHVK
jgi:hypothetical protein